MGERIPRRAAHLALALLVAMAGWSCGGGDGDGGGGGGDGGGTIVTTRRTVTGFVGDATTGRGLVGATVTIGSNTVQTGEGGLFTLPAVPRTDQAVSISANGYRTYTATLDGSTDQITVRLLPAGTSNFDIENPPGPVSS